MNIRQLLDLLEIRGIEKLELEESAQVDIKSQELGHKPVRRTIGIDEAISLVEDLSDGEANPPRYCSNIMHTVLTDEEGRTDYTTFIAGTEPLISGRPMRVPSKKVQIYI